MKLIFISLATTLFFYSCTKNVDDTEKPEINSFTINNYTPTVGSQILVSGNISDNYLLNSYKIILVDDFGFQADVIEETTRFSYLSVIPLINSVDYVINNDVITIPANASAGPYKLKLLVLDQLGNESEEESINFEIVNTINQPKQSITEPTNISVYNQGDTIYPSGNIEDDIALKEIKFETANDSGVFSSLVYDLSSSVTTNWDVNTNGDVKIPIPSVSGNYSLEINISDTTGNLKRESINFLVN